MIDRFGLVTEGMEGLRDFQQKLQQKNADLADWTFSGDYASLLDVMHCAQPDVLIGSTALQASRLRSQRWLVH